MTEKTKTNFGLVSGGGGDIVVSEDIKTNLRGLPLEMRRSIAGSTMLASRLTEGQKVKQYKKGIIALGLSMDEMPVM